MKRGERIRENLGITSLKCCSSTAEPMCSRMFYPGPFSTQPTDAYSAIRIQLETHSGRVQPRPEVNRCHHSNEVPCPTSRTHRVTRRTRSQLTGCCMRKGMSLSQSHAGELWVGKGMNSKIGSSYHSKANQPTYCCLRSHHRLSLKIKDIQGPERRLGSGEHLLHLQRTHMVATTV